MKKLMFPVFGLFFIISVGRAEQILESYHKNDLNHLLNFLRQSAVDTDGKESGGSNAALLMGANGNRGFDDDEVLLKAVNDLHIGDVKVVQWIMNYEEGNVYRLEKLYFSRIKDKSQRRFLSGDFDFRGCTSLTHVECATEKLTSVNLNGCENLQWVDLHSNMIRSAYFENCNNIQTLLIYKNKLLPSTMTYTTPPKITFHFGEQDVTGGRVYADVCIRNNELFLRIDLTDKLVYAEADSSYLEGVDYEHDETLGNGIYYSKPGDIRELTTPLIYYTKMGEKLNYGSIDEENNNMYVKYSFEIIMGTINIYIFPVDNVQQTPDATASVYWVKNNEYILTDTAKKNEQGVITTGLLPAGDYIIRVDADGYLFSYCFKGQEGSSVSSWQDAPIIDLTQNSVDAYVIFDSKMELMNEDITISGVLQAVSKKSLLKATPRVVQRSPVTLHSSTTSSAAKASLSDDEWILVATTYTDDNGNYSFTGLQEGNYRVTVEIPGFYISESIIVQANSSGTVYGNHNFYINEESKTIKTDLATSAYMLDKEVQLSVYPNPVTDMVRIGGLEGVYTVKILNMTGQTVRSVTDISPELTLHLQHLPSGMYLLSIESKGRVYTKKIIKIN